VLGLLTTAHTWRGGDGPYTIAPIVGLILTLLLIRTILRLPVGPATVAISAMFGTVFATLGGRWGYTTTIAVWLVGVVLLASIRRSAGAFPRNLPD
jgi:hypothetical protein